MVKIQHKTIATSLFWLVIITLPMPMLINNIAIILFSIYGIYCFQVSRLKLDFQSLFFPLLLLLSLLSLWYANDVLKGFKALEKIMTFLLFYISLSSISYTKNEIVKFLKAFAYINVILILICLVVASYNVIINGTFIIYNPENFVNENYFLYHRFSKPIGFHAIYLGIYSVFSACVLIFDLKNQNNKIGHYLSLVVLFSGVILLNSFAVTVSCFVIIFFYFFYFRPLLLSKTKGLFLMTLLLIGMGLFYYKAKGINKSVFNYNLQDDVHNPNWNSLNIRLAKWECALEVFKKNKLLGVGVGNGQTELNHEYDIKNFEIGISNKFSTHNQYLHYLVELGIIGALFYLIGLIIIFFKSVKESNFLLFALIVLLGICSITENVLTLNKGIVFFAIFYYLILGLNQTSEES